MDNSRYYPFKLEESKQYKLNKLFALKCRPLEKAFARFLHIQPRSVRTMEKIISKEAVPFPQLMAKLPLELWEAIASHLDPQSAASLTLSCRKMLQLFGIKHWAKLRAIEDPEIAMARKKFVMQFDRYLPGHWFCGKCIVWHKRTKLHPRHSEYSASKPFTLEFMKLYAHLEQLPWPGALILTSQDLITFFEAQSAARFARSGPQYGDPLPTYEQKNGIRGWKHSLRSRYRAGSLLIEHCSVKRFSIKRPQLSEVLSETNGFEVPFIGCLHSRHELTRLMRCALSHLYHLGGNLTSRTCSSCSPLRRCHYCPTEYLISAEGIYNTSGAPDAWKEPFHGFMHVFRWSDLGSCEHEDAYLWNAVARRNDAIRRAQNRDNLWQPFDLGQRPSIRDRFDGPPYLDGPPYFEHLGLVPESSEVEAVRSLHELWRPASSLRY